MKTIVITFAVAVTLGLPVAISLLNKIMAAVPDCGIC
jgi:hypothetical protein